MDTKDLEGMWSDSDVVVEWLNAGETRGSKVHLSRDPDGQPFLTQIEMKVGETKDSKVSNFIFMLFAFLHI